MTTPTLEEIQLIHNNICQAVMDPKRIRIIYALNENSLNVTSIAKALDMPQPTVSRHLAILRRTNIIKRERDGASVIYSLAEPKIICVLETMRQLLRNSLEKQSDKLG